MKVPCAVAFQTADEVMPGRRCFERIAEALIEIHFTVAVEIVQPRQLVAALHVDLIVDNDQPQGMMQSCSDAPPLGDAFLFRIGVQPGHTPDIALDSTYDGAAVTQKIMSPAENQRFPGVVERQFDCVDRIGPAITRFDHSRQHLRPLDRPPFVMWRSG